jgi:O-antigen/teichoic acid export membrane protein
MTTDRTGAQPPRPAARRVLEGAALLGTTQIVSRLIAMVFTLVIARLMTVADFGLLNLALSMVVVFALIQDLGVSRTVVKEVARRPEDAAYWIGRLLPVKLLLACVAAVSMPAFALAFGYDGSTIGVLGVAAFMLPSAAAWLLLENAAQAVGAVGILARVTLTNAVLQSGLGLVAAYAWGGDPRVLVAALAVANLLGTVVLWRLVVRRIGPIAPTVDVVFSRRTIAASLPYLVVAIAVAALGRVELLMLARLAGEEPAGIFAAAFKIFEAMLFVVYATQIAMNPILAKLLTGDRSVLDRWLDWEFGVLAAAVVPALVGAYLFAGPVISLLYPPAFAEAGVVLAVLVAALPVVALQVFTAGVLMLTDRRGAVLFLNLAVLAAQAGLSWLLIPPFGALGAAVALACSQALAAALGLAMIAHKVAGRSAFGGFARMLVASVVALAAGFAVSGFAGALPGIAVAIVVLGGCVPFAKMRLMPPG